MSTGDCSWDLSPLVIAISDGLMTNWERFSRGKELKKNSGSLTSCITRNCCCYCDLISFEANRRLTCKMGRKGRLS